MANKVFQIGDDSDQTISKKYSLEVYRDIAMQSVWRSNDSQSTSSKGSYKVSKNVNVNAVKGALKNIFTWIPGERILLPEFGSRLYSLLYEGITAETEERIVAEIRHCVSEWEPRASIVEIRNISNVDDTEDNTIHIEVVFTIAGLDDQQFTYSFTYNKED